MEFTERQLKLILLALDNTSTQLHNEATYAGSERAQAEADEMDNLYHNVLSEIVILENAHA
jgi:hypothetical protein